MNFSRPGAVDLSGLGAGAPTASDGVTFAVDATEDDFQQLAIDASLRHVVVLSVWSARSPQSVEFNQLLTRVVDSYAGQASLVRVDVDANPGIAQAIGVQSVPLVLGLIKGQPVPLFQSTADEQQIRAVMEQLFQVAIQNGLAGRAPAQAGAAAADADEPIDDPRFAVADIALAAGDLDAAIAEYESLAGQFPRDDEIRERLAGVRLMGRVRDVDLNAARQAAASDPGNVEAQLLVADLDVSGGHVEDAFSRLLEVIRTTGGADRDRARERLVDLFTVVGIADPRVATARRALASALF